MEGTCREEKMEVSSSKGGAGREVAEEEEEESLEMRSMTEGGDCVASAFSSAWLPLLGGVADMAERVEPALQLLLCRWGRRWMRQVSVEVEECVACGMQMHSRA